jgi:NADH:ubiquinone oxidoreductase subunit 2 (subunit N)
MPFMLLAGWLLSNMGNDVSNPGDFLPVAVFLGIGFVFLLAIFPLNTWIPMLMESVNPYSAAFLITIFPFVVIGLLRRFLGRYPWLLDSDVILTLGIIMVITGGLWAAFQRDLGRFLGYAVIIEIGRFLLAISQPSGELVYEAILIPHILTLGLWALALSLLRTKVDDLRFESVQGIGRQFPLIALGVLTAHFSIAGFPLLASFPALFALLEQLAQDSLSLALWALFGSAGLLIGGLRTMVVFVTGPEDLPWSGAIDRTTKVLLILGTIAIVIVGLFPQSIITLLAKISIDI